jgi:hypothetical protein
MDVAAEVVAACRPRVMPFHQQIVLYWLLCCGVQARAALVRAWRMSLMMLLQLVMQLVMLDTPLNSKCVLCCGCRPAPPR